MERSVKLECRGVWKIYGGAHPEAFLAKHNGAPSSEEFERAHMVGAVRDANVQVFEGEIFVIMGLSGSGKSTWCGACPGWWIRRPERSISKAATF